MTQSTHRAIFIVYKQNIIREFMRITLYHSTHQSLSVSVCRQVYLCSLLVSCIQDSFIGQRGDAAFIKFLRA